MVSETLQINKFICVDCIDLCLFVNTTTIDTINIKLEIINLYILHKRFLKLNQYQTKQSAFTFIIISNTAVNQ